MGTQSRASTDGGEDRAARVWDAGSGALLRMLFGADGWFCLEFEEDPQGAWRGDGTALARLRDL